MMFLNGRMYVIGCVEITPLALSRLRELGVNPRRAPCGEFGMWGGHHDSFYLPEGESGEEFKHVVGNPSTPGRLSLRTE